MSRWNEPPKDKNAPANADKKTATWDDGLADASPKKAQYFDALRTYAYVNQNIVDNYVEFWAAFRVDQKSDQWRVMHYMIFDLNLRDGKFVAEKAIDKDVSFMEAVAHLARSEYLAGKMMTTVETNLEEKYPPAQYPELKVHFFDLDHYKDAANVEGIAFDEYNDPYRRVQGKIFSNATFKRSEVVKSILSAEQSASEKVVNRMEEGILTDIFASASGRTATLDGILKIGECLAAMDDFTMHIGAFYLAVQKVLGKPATYEAIEGLNAADKDRIFKDTAKKLSDYVRYFDDSSCLTEDILPRAEKMLNKAEALGVHVEPFRKFVAECELYAHMLNATQKLPILEQGLMSANTSDINMITEIKESVFNAQKKFIQLGGTEEQMDKIKAWIANPTKDMIPQWLPGFLTRYYDTRGKVMARVQERNAGLKQVKLMSADVKPPLADESSARALPGATAQKALPGANDDKAAMPQAEALDVDKYKSLNGSGGGKKSGGPSI